MRSRALLPALLALGAGISISRGQDAAWDLKNYHLYNAWAFLHARLGTDLAPASMQSFFNPLLDLPYFWLGTGPLASAPRILAGFQGLWYGALVYALCRITLRFATQSGRMAHWTDVVAIVIGATGTMTLSQAGMSTNEVPLSLLVLAGYFIAMPLVAMPEGAKLAARAMTAGLVCGLAAGLKPTAVVYAPALGGAVWIATGFSRTGTRAAALIGLGSVAGFLASYAAWGYALWTLTGNPIFPMFNQVFHSPWMPVTSGTDRQFMPRSLTQAVLYPFWWLEKNTTQGGNAFADARYALAMIALVAAGLAAAIARGRLAPSPARRMLFAFLAIGYGLWLALYSILRYAVPIEILTGLAFLASAELVGAAFSAERRRIVSLAMASMLVVVLATTRYTDWGHAPFGRTAFPVQAPVVVPGSLVVILSAPNGYVVPFVRNAEAARFVSLTWFNANGAGYGFSDRVNDAIVKHAGPMYAVLRDTSEPEQAMLRALLPRYRFTSCARIASGIEQTRRRRDLSDNLRLCEIQRERGA
ncbi:hypothetical protein [Luteibacter sp. UNC138MFCol5.1]|uniref:hypothetical protein n=1 Tax=Luteibacter sp. UNC138MFCol5.1 TaxID=1502774 RepID=UPI00116090F5|nr:hypothetical protein [Luteibacter sp. UNC138MFCol5.1]